MSAVENDEAPTRYLDSRVAEVTHFATAVPLIPKRCGIRAAQDLLNLMASIFGRRIRLVRMPAAASEQSQHCGSDQQGSGYYWPRQNRVQRCSKAGSSYVASTSTSLPLVAMNRR